MVLRGTAKRAAKETPTTTVVLVVLCGTDPVLVVIGERATGTENNH